LGNDFSGWLNEQLAEQLGQKKIQRGQVYRVYQQWLEEQEITSLNSMVAVRNITDEQAEAEAEIEDKQPKKEKKP
jgi:hypothetical protein